MENKLRTFLFICLLTGYTSFTSAQNKEIIGTWRPFAIDNGEFYMNIETDSISLIDELKSVYNDSLKVRRLKDNANKLYFQQTHKFSEKRNICSKFSCYESYDAI